MDITSFTTNDEIRSLLGVTAKELADAVLSLPHWWLTTEQELRDIDGGAGAALTQYATVAAINPITNQSADQSQFYKVTRLYVLYSVGRQLIQSADVFQPVRIGDGKAQVQRLAEAFDKLRPALDGGFQALKERMKAALAVLVPSAQVSSTPARVFIVSVGLGTDPVTGV